MHTIDEIRRRCAEILAMQDPGLSAQGPGCDTSDEARFYARFRGEPRLEMLRAGKRLGVSPYFLVADLLDGPTVRVGGRELLMLGSNNYLGLTRHPEVIQAAHDAIDRFGTSCTGSRLLNGTISLHISFEEEIADFLGYPGAILFTTGYMANQGGLPCLLRDGDQVFSDHSNHASIVDGLSQKKYHVYRFKHGNTEHLEKRLKTAACGKPRLIVTESVFSITGDVTDLPGLMRTARTYGSLVYLDEAHGLGTLGMSGRGSAEHFGLSDKPDFVMGTLSKSLASVGGFIAGPSEVIDYLKFCARSFVFSASGNPAAVAAGLAALRVMRREPQLVEAARSQARYLSDGLINLGYKCSPATVPILSVKAADPLEGCTLHAALTQAGLLTNLVLYPAVLQGEALLRVSVMSSHTRDHLDRALSIFRAVGRQMGIIPETDYL